MLKLETLVLSFMPWGCLVSANAEKIVKKAVLNAEKSVIELQKKSLIGRINVFFTRCAECNES